MNPEYTDKTYRYLKHQVSKKYRGTFKRYIEDAPDEAYADFFKAPIKKKGRTLLFPCFSGCSV